MVAPRAESKNQDVTYLMREPIVKRAPSPGSKRFAAYNPDNSQTQHF